MTQDGPFDRRLRRIRRDRAARLAGAADYLETLVGEELIERLTLVKRDFADALVLGCGSDAIASALRARGMPVVASDVGFVFAGRAGGVQCDEDRLPFCDAGFDLVISAGGLDRVNDLPGALTLIRRVLRPDGLFLAAFAGAGSLPRLRNAMLAADLASGPAVAPRIHPQIDVRAAGDLLMRAGFALPVADSHAISIRLSGMGQLVADLRALGATNILLSRPPSLGRRGLAAAIADFAAHADTDGKTAERLEIVYLTAWSPSSDQPRPARRGSAAQSLADVLKPPRRGDEGP